MTWTQHHEPAGIPDYPEQLPFSVCIEHYWANENGTRIGYFGRGRHETIFTYRCEARNFKFTASRSDGSDALVEYGFKGPLCYVYIKGPVHGSIYEDELRSIKDNIESFIYIFKDPYHAEAGAVERVEFPFIDLYLKKTGREQHV